MIERHISGVRLPTLLAAFGFDKVDSVGTQNVNGELVDIVDGSHKI